MMRNFALWVPLLVASQVGAETPWDVVDPLDHAGLDIFGYDLVTGGHQSTIYAGAVGSNLKIELGPNVTYRSDVVSGGSVVPQNSSSWSQSIHGGLWAASVTQPYVWAVRPSQYPIGNWTHRAKTYFGNASYGSQNVVVGDFQTLNLAPGAYGAITMGAGAKLVLRAGKYALKSFSSAPALEGASSNVGAEIIYDVSGGDVQVDVYDKLFFAGGTKASFQGQVLPSRVHWNTWQISQLDLVSDATYFYGNVSAPQATVKLSNGSILVGGIRAKQVDLGYSTKVCSPPSLLSLWHAAGPLGPAFDPSVNDYKSVLRPEVTTDTLYATAPAGIDVSYPDGKVVAPNGTYRVRLSDPLREAFLPGCGVSEYRVNLATSSDYALRVKETNANCGPGAICDGSTWDKALVGVAAAVKNYGREGKEFWVAEGNYALTGLSLNNAVVRGGFTGSETDPERRKGHPYSTVITGNGNAQHVVMSRNLVRMDNVRITGGVGTRDGAAVYAGLGRFELEQSVLDGNQGSGRGVVYYGMKGSDAILKRNYISKNTILDGVNSTLVGLGAGANFYGENLVISENELGSGVLSGATDSRVHLNHNTIIGNKSGVALFGGGVFDVLNSVIWQPNNLMSGVDGRVGVSHSLVVPFVNGIGNLSSEPQLIGLESYGADGVPFTGDDGLSPSKTSPVVGSGLATDIKDDLFYVQRKSNATLGAREYVPTGNDQVYFIVKDDPLMAKVDPVKMNVASFLLADVLLEYEKSIYNYSLIAKVPLNKYTSNVLNFVTTVSCGSQSNCFKANSLQFSYVKDEDGYRYYMSDGNGNNGFFVVASSQIAALTKYDLIGVEGEEMKLNFNVSLDQF